MIARKKVEIAARRKFILDKMGISRGPSGGWIVTVCPWKIGDGGGGDAIRRSDRLPRRRLR